MTILEGTYRTSELRAEYPSAKFDIVADGYDSHHLRATIGDDVSIANFYSSFDHMQEVLSDLAEGVSSSYYWSGAASEALREAESLGSWTAKSDAELRADAEQKLADLWTALLDEAKSRGWCGEYDRFARLHGGPVRTSRQIVYLRFPVQVEIPYTESNEERAEAWAKLSNDERTEAKRAALRSYLASVVDEDKLANVVTQLAYYLYDPETR